VTARTEFYENPTALPTVEQSSIKLDLHRRDFTINTLAIRLAPEPFGQLLDFWGGERDLRDGRVRVLHSLSFVDDPTRILRAARFEQRFGFRIEERTLGLIEGALPLLDRVSGPRLRHELELILVEARPELVLRRLQDLGVLARLHPDLAADDWLFAAYEALRQARQSPPWTLKEMTDSRDGWMLALFVVLCCRLTAEAAERIGQRLQVKRQALDEMANGVKTYRERLPALADWQKPSTVVRLLGGLSDVGLVVAWAIAPTYPARQQIVRYVTEWKAVRQSLTGHDLRALGVQQGPVYGRLLRRLRDARLDGEVQTPDEERALVLRLLAEPEGEGDDAQD